MVVVCLIFLFLEAAFLWAGVANVFWYACRSFRETIAKLRKQTPTLTKSYPKKHEIFRNIWGTEA